MSRRKKILVLIINMVLIWAVVVGCVEKEPLDEAEPQGEPASVEIRNIAGYFPALTGMTYYFEGEGNEYASFTREVKYVDGPYLQVLDNTGGTIIATVYKVEDERVIQVLSEGEFYSGHNLLEGIGEVKGKEEVILKTPLQAGTTWESDEWKREIIALDQTVTVPAGIFQRVLKLKKTSKAAENQAETYEYYAENVGLIMREYRDKDFVVTSKLKSYGMQRKEEAAPSTPAKSETQGVSLSNPHLLLLAYQLEHQLRSAFQAAYESFINMDKLAKQSSENFQQISALYGASLSSFAIEEVIEAQKERLRQYFEAGEGEVTFPSHEVVKQTKLIGQTANTATVCISVQRYYPAREWSGAAYDRTVDYIVELRKVDGQWRLAKTGGVD